MARRRKYRPRRMRSRDAAKVKCMKVRNLLGQDNWLCAYGAKYGVSVRVYAKGQAAPRDAADWAKGGKWLPVPDGGARTVSQGLRAGRQFLRRVKMKSR